MRRWFPAACIAAALVASIVLYPQLPEQMPVHWGIDGRPNGYGGRTVGAFLLPVLMLGVWGVRSWLPSRDPRAANIQKFRASYDLSIDTLMGVLLAVHVTALGAAIGWPIRVSIVAPILLGIMFIVIGNVMPRARSNFIFGVRTPWTLSDDAVWMRSQRVGGYLLCVAGLAFIVAPFFPAPWGIGTAIVVSLVAALGSVVYSYVLWSRGRRG